MTISERMFSLMDEKNKRPYQLCAILGVGTAQTSSWKNRGSDPPAKYIPQIAAFLGVSIEYLLTGKDTCNGGLSEMEQEVLQIFRQLPKDAQYDFRGQLKGYAMATSENKAKKADVG